MHITRTFLTRAAAFFVVTVFVSGVGTAGCGRSDLLLFPDDIAGDDGGLDSPFPEDTGFPEGDPFPFDAPSFQFDAPSFQFDGPFPIDGPTLSDVRLPNDVTVPPSCGDHLCNDGETCTTCPEDCGSCVECGDGKCESGETCLSCPQDCGICPSCGDGKCTAPDETCFTCPEDCGSCKGCGDGVCETNETCASCQSDCGPCAVCGNGVCEGPYETCGNCPTDCGACANTCLGVLKCAFACKTPPLVACIFDCGGSGACPAANFRIDNLLECGIANLGTCGGFNLACIEQQCTSEVTQCIDNTCDDGDAGM